MRALWKILRQSFDCFIRDDAMEMAAAVAFYSVLSLGPIVVITLTIVDKVWGDLSTREQVVQQVETLAGKESARVVEVVISAAAQPRGFGAAAIVSIVTLIVAANGVFAQLQAAMNKVWNVKPHQRWVWGFFRRRLISLSMLIFVSLAVIASLVSTAIISLAVQYLGDDPTISIVLPRYLAAGSSFVIFTLLFGIMFRVLPDVTVPWIDVWVGATVTAVLFAIGKELIGLYLRSAGVGSAYGAAGSLVVFLVWIYYSAIILFAGAEFTRAFAQWRGDRVLMEDYAEAAHSEPSTELAGPVGSGE